MTDMFRRVTLTAAAGLGLCLALLPAGQAQAHAPQTPTRVPCNDIAALKAAIDNANTSGRGIVLAPRCTYFLTAPDNADDGLPEITGKVADLRRRGNHRPACSRLLGLPHLPCETGRQPQPGVAHRPGR